MGALCHLFMLINIAMDVESLFLMTRNFLQCCSCIVILFFSRKVHASWGAPPHVFTLIRMNKRNKATIGATWNSTTLKMIHFLLQTGGMSVHISLHNVFILLKKCILVVGWIQIPCQIIT